MKEDNVKFMVGQRVIYDEVICTVATPIKPMPSCLWVYNPDLGYEHFVDRDNLKPLPNGQL